jgi:hypothetical protein
MQPIDTGASRQVTNEEFVRDGRKEISSYLAEIAKFGEHKDLQHIFERLSAYSARITHMQIQSVKSTNKDVVRFSDNELTIFSKEIEQQFRIWSRYEAVLSREWNMVR